jgi:tetratricopeptide (TPR) repeat protein
VAKIPKLASDTGIKRSSSILRHAEGSKHLKQEDLRRRGVAERRGNPEGKASVRDTAKYQSIRLVRRPTVRIKPVGAVSERRSEIHPLDRAINELHNELARSPDDATLHGRLGALHYRRGDLKAAEECYRRALKLQPHRPSFHNNLGNILCDHGHWREGLACYEQALALERVAHPDRPPSAEAVTNLELARMEFRLIHERIEYFEKVVQLEVDSAEALNALGGACLLRRDFQRALASMRRAVQLDPRNVHAARNLGFVLTLDLESLGEPQKAIAELAENAIRFPNEPRLFIHQGELYELSGMLEEAEGLYLRALRADPRCLEVYDLLGRLREVTGAAGDRDEAAKLVEKELTRLERAANASRRKKGEASGAVPLFDLAFVEVARSRFLKTPIANALAVDALLRDAIQAAQPDHVADVEAGSRAALLRTQLLESEGRRDEATVALESACERFPKAARLWFERGGLCFRQGDIKNALEAFERATLADPQEAYTYQSLRFAFDGYRRYRSERVRFEAAVSANPRDAMAHHHLALASLTVRKDDEALLHFTQALEIDPRLAEAACGKARVLQRQGHLEDAEKAAREALGIDPECVEAARLIHSLKLQKPNPT